jgi:VanZ family protein
LHLQRTIRFVAWLLAAAIIILSVVPPELRPETTLPHDLEHAGIFWMTGLAFGFAYDFSKRWLATYMTAFSAAVELVQLFVPGRHARLRDFIVDAAAICFGLIIAWSARSIGLFRFGLAFRQWL